MDERREGRQLDRIERTLGRIERSQVALLRGVVSLMAGEQELETAVADVEAAETAQNTAVLSALADLEAEVAALPNVPQSVIDRLNAVKAAAGAEQEAATAADPGPQPPQP